MHRQRSMAGRDFTALSSVVIAFLGGFPMRSISTAVLATARQDGLVATT